MHHTLYLNRLVPESVFDLLCLDMGGMVAFAWVDAIQTRPASTELAYVLPTSNAKPFAHTWIRRILIDNPKLAPPTALNMTFLPHANFAFGNGLALGLRLAGEEILLAWLVGPWVKHIPGHARLSEMNHAVTAPTQQCCFLGRCVPRWWGSTLGASSEIWMSNSDSSDSDLDPLPTLLGNWVVAGVGCCTHGRLGTWMAEPAVNTTWA